MSAQAHNVVRLFHALNDPVLILDAETAEIVFANPASCTFLSLAAHRLLGRSAGEMLFFPVENALEAALERCRSWPDSDHVPLILKGSIGTGAGSRVPVVIRLCVLPGEDAERRLVLAVLRDEGEPADTKYRSIFENAVEGMYQTARDGHFLTANPMLARIFGFASVAELLADARETEDHFYVQPGRRAEFVRLLDEQGTLTGFESPIRRKDGRPAWISENARTLRDAESRIVGYEGTVVDITERKQAEEAQRARARETALAADVGVALNSAGALPRMLHRCAEAIVLHLDAAFARIWTLSESAQLLELQASAGLYTHLDGKHSQIPVGQFKIGHIAQSRRPHLTNDVLNDPLISDPAWARREGMVAFAGCPLVVEDRLVGVLALFSRQAVPDGTLQVLTSIADAVAQCIDRKRTEEELRDSRALYQSLVESLPHSVWRKDTDGRYAFANRRFCAALGKPLRDILGRTDFDLFPPELAKVYDAGDRWVQETGITFEAVEEGRSADGRPIHLQVLKTPIWDARGACIGTQGAFFDVTERARAESGLRRSELQFRLVWESSVDGMRLTDADGIMLRVNEAFCRMVGKPREELEGQPISMVYAPELRERILQGHRQRWASRTIEAQFERDLVLWNGKNVSFALSNSFVEGEGQSTLLLSIIRDASERKRTQQQLQMAHEKLQGWVRELEARTREISLLNEMGDLLQTCLSRQEAYAVVARAAERLFPGDQGLIGALSDDEKTVEVAATWGPSPPGEKLFGLDDCWALRRGRVHLVPNPEQGLLCRHVRPPLPAGYLCVPLVAQGKSLGVLHLAQLNPDTPTENRQRLAVALTEHVALALANLKLYETLRHQSIRDPLTGLFNRRYMEESLEREVRRAERNQRPLGILMIDIDHFKEFNDASGHDAGDALLRALGGFLHTHTRGEDIACRYGGEEFVLILLDISLAHAQRRAEQLREGVKHLQVQHRGQLIGPITLSVGVAMYPEHGPTGEAVFRAADAALYRAKREGRDRVMLAGP